MTDAFNNLYSGQQAGELDRQIIEDHGVDGFELMSRAATAAFDCLRRHWPQARHVGVVCGPGNNGGDGFLMGKLALAAGMRVTLVMLGERAKAQGDAARAIEAFENAGGTLQSFDGQLPSADPASPRDASSVDALSIDVWVDALLGTGLSRDVEGDFRSVVEALNAAGEDDIGIFAVDIPSGLDAATGKRWGVAVYADVTATFIGCKLGLYTGAGPGHTGQVEYFDLDVPAQVYKDNPPLAWRLSDADLKQALRPRRADAHKGGNGHVLCVGGNTGMGGAVRMAAEAALRSGAGLVSVATQPEHASAMAQARPELMCRGITRAEQLAPLLRAVNVAAVGPGLGQDQWALDLLGRLFDSKLPLIVDADALNLLAADPVDRGHWILTPHPGEAARLLNIDVPAVQADRPAAVAELAARYKAVVVLKGAGTLVQAPEGRLWLCDAGNPGMATGGMGDLLTGVIAGLLAQGLSLEDAARIGVLLHARAGDAAAQAGGERGLLPSDMLDGLRRCANPA